MPRACPEVVYLNIRKFRLQIMLAQIQYEGESFAIDFSKPIDISLSLRGDDKNPIAWYLDSPKITPFRDGDFIGKVSEGASVNFNNIQFNPHAHGTHTECVGHISKEFFSINQSLKNFFFKVKLSFDKNKKTSIFFFVEIFFNFSHQPDFHEFRGRS